MSPGFRLAAHDIEASLYGTSLGVSVAGGKTVPHGHEHHLRAIRRKLATQVAQVSAAITEHFPAGTRVSRPAGGFVLWVELPPGTNALELHARALAQQISVAPGPIFSAKPRCCSG